jgi:hypothetical protein
VTYSVCSSEIFLTLGGGFEDFPRAKSSHLNLQLTASPTTRLASTIMRSLVLLLLLAGALLFLGAVPHAEAGAIPPDQAIGRLGDACTSSNYANCSTSCCFEGKCSSSEICFGQDVSGAVGAPCTASEVGQCATGCCFEGSCAETEQCFGGTPVTMFVQTGKQIVTSPNTDANSSDVYPWLLSLKEPQDSTIWFTNRPYRIGGRVPNSDFLDSIGDTEEDPVNAAVVGSLNGSEVQSVVLVEIANGRIQEGDGSIQYLARKLPEVKAKRSSLMQGMTAYDPQDLSNRSFVFDYASLFIDDCPDGTIVCLDREFNYIGVHFRGQCWNWMQFGCRFCDRALQSYEGQIDYCNRVHPQYNGSLCVLDNKEGPGRSMACGK